MKKIALVACVSKKHNQPRPAGQMYTSALFTKASAYAKHTTDEWYILSAKHGLVDPQRIIAPYDETLNKMPIKNRRAWAAKVWMDLRKILRSGDTVIMLAGQRYREHLIQPIRSMGCQIRIPMEGLTIGKQMQWLDRQSER